MYFPPLLVWMTSNMEREKQIISLRWYQRLNSKCLLSGFPFAFHAACHLPHICTHTFLLFLQPVTDQNKTQGYCCCLVTHSYLTLCDPVDFSPPGSSVHGILQARILEWVAISFSISHNTATAKSLQSCPTVCDPINGSPRGSPVPGILQARTLAWVAISFSRTIQRAW